MGNKETKVKVDQLITLAGRGEDTKRGSGSKKKLAGYLASLSNMARDGQECPDVPDAASRLMGEISPDTLRRLTAQLRKKYQMEVPVNEDAKKQLELLTGLQNQDEDDGDWESMRGWLVWCMRNNLDDDPDDEDLDFASSSRRRLSRQHSQDSSRGRRLSHQSGFEVNRDGRMSNQSSLESTPET